MSDEVKTLVTTDYDAADKTLDKLIFAECAVVNMMDGYSDSVINGLLEILDDSTTEIRRYIKAMRAALQEIEAEQGDTE